MLVQDCSGQHAGVFAGTPATHVWCNTPEHTFLPVAVAITGMICTCTHVHMQHMCFQMSLFDLVSRLSNMHMHMQHICSQVPWIDAVSRDEADLNKGDLL